MMGKLVGLLAGWGLILASLAFTPRQAITTAAGPIYLPLVLHSADLVARNSLDVSAATYLGGNGSDSARAVDILPDGTVVWAGVLPGYSPPGIVPTTLLGGGNGLLLRLDRTGRTVLGAARIGNSISDLETTQLGQVAVCGDFGVALLDSTLSTVLWNADPGTAKRCAAGSDGTVAVLTGGNVFVYGSTGTPLGNWSVGGSAQNDVAVDPLHGLVIATGWTQKPPGGDLQVAFLKAWSFNGQVAWIGYDWAESAVSAANLGADTRGERIAIGRDAQLYFAATINGGTGASIFARDPKDLALSVGRDRNVAMDSYNTASNVGSITMTWFGRFNPADGTLLRGTSFLTRLSNGSGNSIVPRAIMADEAGRVFLAGESACCLPNRTLRQVAGITVGDYALGEGFFAAFTADLGTRTIWTPFTAPATSAGGSPAVAVSARSNVIAISLTLNASTSATRRLITANALQATPGTLPEAYLAVWPLPEQ